MRIQGTVLCVDSEKNHYFQFRYYDPHTGRFLNADDTASLGVTKTALSYNIFAYCENNSVNYIDSFGFWAEDYSGFKVSNVGFNVNVHLNFLSRTFCKNYARDIINTKGTGYWWGRGYKNMSLTRIARELWFHALVYYVGTPIKKVLNKLGVSWTWLDSKLEQAKYMEINNNDNRDWIYILFWNATSYVKIRISLVIGYRFPYSYIRV